MKNLEIGTVVTISDGGVRWVVLGTDMKRPATHYKLKSKRSGKRRSALMVVCEVVAPSRKSSKRTGKDRAYDSAHVPSRTPLLPLGVPGMASRVRFYVLSIIECGAEDEPERLREHLEYCRMLGSAEVFASEPVPEGTEFDGVPRGTYGSQRGYVKLLADRMRLADGDD